MQEPAHIMYQSEGMDAAIYKAGSHLFAICEVPFYLQKVLGFVLLGIFIGLAASWVFRKIGVYGSYNPDEISEADIKALVTAFELSIGSINSIKGQTSGGIGLILCRGPELEMVTTNAAVRKMLSWGDGTKGTDGSLWSINDIIPLSIRNAHKRWMARCSEENELPESLKHPLRLVDVECGDKVVRKFNISVGRLTTDLPVGHKEGLFYALLSAVVKPKATESGEDLEAWNQIAAAYGYNVANDLAEGNIPDPEDFKETCVLSLSIVNYAQLTAEVDAGKVSEWMSSIHGIVADLCKTYSVQRVQTRADGLICITGTNKVAGDISNTAVSRMKDFTLALHQKLGDQEMRTILKTGISVGPCTMAFIKTSERLPSVSLFGDAVNLANRLQLRTQPGFVNFGGSAVARLAAEKEDLSLLEFSGASAAWLDIKEEEFISPISPQEFGHRDTNESNLRHRKV